MLHIAFTDTKNRFIKEGIRIKKKKKKIALTA